MCPRLTCAFMPFKDVCFITTTHLLLYCGSLVYFLLGFISPSACDAYVRLYNNATLSAPDSHVRSCNLNDVYFIRTKDTSCCIMRPEYFLSNSFSQCPRRVCQLTPKEWRRVTKRGVTRRAAKCGLL